MGGFSLVLCCKYCFPNRLVKGFALLFNGQEKMCNFSGIRKWRGYDGAYTTVKIFSLYSNRKSFNNLRERKFLKIFCPCSCLLTYRGVICNWHIRQSLINTLHLGPSVSNRVRQPERGTGLQTSEYAPSFRDCSISSHKGQNITPRAQDTAVL